MTTATKRAAIYVRVSSEKQLENYSPATQEAACRNHARELGYAVEDQDIYTDAYSGETLWERPILSTLREAVEAKKYEAVIVHHTERLARDPDYQVYLRVEWVKHGTKGLARK